jgi:hypothetical protein
VAMGFVSGYFGLPSLRIEPGEASMVALTSDRKQIGVRPRGDRAAMTWGCRPRRREGANRFDGVRLAARWDPTRSEIVGGIIMIALMKCRTKTATSWTEAIGRRGEGRR